MKDRLIGFIKTYCLFVCIFVLHETTSLCCFTNRLIPGASCADWFSVIWHGVTFRPISGWLSDSYSRFSFHNLCMDTF